MMLTIPGAFAQEARTGRWRRSDLGRGDQAVLHQYRRPARDQRYLLQKQELEKLRADVDTRIAEMQKRRPNIRTG
jgi:flagellar motility protein MotE (MotC chaperone)